MDADTHYRGFFVKKVTHVEEIQVTVYEIVHEKSNAEIIHIAAEDEENVFALCFKTYPKDNSGVAHILEHTVLCGSHHFPVHDPFFSMLRRSLNTFMNAFTAKLWTCYPAASKNKKDFYNLFEVYLDAVFHPLLKKESFHQEGHRLEFVTPDDPSSDLVRKGIVFNEMKGVFANPGSLFWRKLMQGLCPDHTYGFDSGGDPKEIPNLTYEDLLSFHKKYYHPSRCSYFFYGDIDVKEHLDFLENHILNHIEKEPPIAPVAKQKRFDQPQRGLDYYPLQDEDTKQKTFIGFSWLTADIQDQDDLLALALIDSILMDTDASLLKYKLTESGLCIDANAHLDTDARDIPYAIICQGCEEENADALEKLLLNSLQEIAEEKIKHDLIEASLHQLEFSRSEISSDYQPYGLELFGRTILSHLQGGSLIDGLKIHSLFERFSKLLEDADYLPGIIRKYLIDNPHRYRLVMAPKQGLQEKSQKEEEDLLKKEKEQLSEEEIKTILKETKELEEDQKAKQSEVASCLPMLTEEDIPQSVSYFALEKDTIDRLAIYHHSCFTNKIVYTDIVYDLPQIDESDLLYLRLFAVVLTELGAGGRNYIKTLHEIQRYVGDISTSLSLNVQRGQITSCYPTISVSGKALERNSHHLFRLIKDFILSPDFHDKERVKELVLQAHTNMQHRLQSSAMQYALRESASGFTSWNYVSHIWHGLPYYKFIESLSQNIDEAMDTLIEQFESLKNRIFHLNNPHLVVSSDQTDFDHLKKEKFYGFSKFSDASTSFIPWVEIPNPKGLTHKGKILSSPIAHNALSIQTVTITANEAAPLKVSSYLFENLILHKKIREEGGAYITGVKYNILTGLFQFYSSRDPNIFSSYKAFIEAVETIALGKFQDQHLLEAKLSYFQDVDSVVSPGSRASVTYFQHKVGLTKEVRQQFRNQILSVTKQDVIHAVIECLVPKIKDESIRVTYANKALLEKNNALFESAFLAPLHIEPLT